jgi:predicted membrane protein
METQHNYPHQPQNNGKALAGLVLLAVGGALLLRQFDLFFIPRWIFSWPMLLIVIGLYTGAKNNFKKPGALITILIGVIFLSGDISPWIDLSRFWFPIVVIAIGLWLIVKRNHQNTRWGNAEWKAKHAQFDDAAFAPEVDYVVRDQETEPTDAEKKTDNGYNTSDQYTRTNYTGDSVIDAVSVFGGIKKVILSKDFKGGEIVNIFGGAEIDFSQADINGTVMIEVTQIFGGVKLVVPPHWSVTSDMAAVFASVDDKRFGKFATKTPLNPDKLLVIKGVSIFAGIDVRSF